MQAATAGLPARCGKPIGRGRARTFCPTRKRIEEQEINEACAERPSSSSVGGL